MTRLPRSCSAREQLSDEEPARSAAVHKVKWTDREDQMLIAYVEQHGTSNWSMVASGIPGRTGKQCRERWTHRLDPNLNREIWTPQEDAILLYQQKVRGNCWSKFAEFLPRRSATALKNRWCWLARHSANLGGGEKRAELPKAEAPKEKKAEITVAEWSEVFDLSGIPEWLRGDWDFGREQWETWSQTEGAVEKMDGCEFGCGVLSWT
jgi:hypothetical protein